MSEKPITPKDRENLIKVSGNMVATGLSRLFNRDYLGAAESLLTASELLRGLAQLEADRKDSAQKCRLLGIKP